jgi:hypothetical protein
MNVDYQKYYPMLYVDHTHTTNDPPNSAPPDPENTDTQTSLERVRFPKPPDRCNLRTLPLGQRNPIKEFFRLFSLFPAHNDTVQHAHSWASPHD